MSYAKLSVTFKNSREIRMGSPFKIADIELQGKWIPDLPDYGWQDVFAESPRGRFLALVAWAITESSGPAFRIVVIDKKEKKLHESDQFLGVCKKLRWSAHDLAFESICVVPQNQIFDWKS